MISNVSEKKMHYLRWLLLIGWVVLIWSLFWDPISHHLTAPDNLLSPFRNSRAANTSLCVKVQGECLPNGAYPMGARIFWGMIVPSGIMVVFVFGHETWRRICPLYFVSQIQRALGLKPLLKIKNNRWLVQNHFYVQFALLFFGLNCRILFVNSARLALGLFLLVAISSAMIIVFLYGGRSWCHYFCPFGIVQMVFTGPRGLLGSEAHKASHHHITQSMCRTIARKAGHEKSACINCKSPCLDIDAEKAYWEQLRKPGRKLVQYGYLGLVIGYLVYYYLYSGNWDYYFSGAWHHELNQLGKIFSPGFYIFDRPIPIPKLLAAPLTLGFFVGVSCLICTKLEKAMFSYLKRRHHSISRQQVIHRVFSLSTFFAFNFFFIYGSRPEIIELPMILQSIFNAFVVMVSTFWLTRTWGRSAEKYRQESLADRWRFQLEKECIDFEQLLKGRSLKELEPNELEILNRLISA